jgi:hypothetical protein
MDAFNEVNFLLVASVVDELLLEVFELRICLVESSEIIIDLPLPEPVVLFKVTKELVDVVLGALEGTSKKQDDLDNFLIFGNPIIEWLPLVLWLILLVPVLDILG